jgi:hypothetical protein
MSGARLVGTAEASGVAVFVSGEKAEQIAVGNGAENLRAIAVIAETAGGEDGRPLLAVFGFQALKRGEGDAVSAVEVVESVKELGFALMIGTLGCGAPGTRASGSCRFCAIWDGGARGFRVLGCRLRGWIGACSFTNSHGGLLSGHQVRARSVSKAPGVARLV